MLHFRRTKTSQFSQLTNDARENSKWRLFMIAGSIVLPTGLVGIVPVT